MSLEVTSIGFVGTNPESTPLPGVDYSKNQQEVYEEKRHKISTAVEPERERKIECCGMRVSGEAGTERSMPICTKTDKVGKHWKK